MMNEEYKNSSKGKILVKETIDLIDQVVQKIQSLSEDLDKIYLSGSEFRLTNKSSKKISFSDSMEIGDIVFKAQEQLRYLKYQTEYFRYIQFKLNESVPYWDGEYEEKTNDPT